MCKIFKSRKRTEEEKEINSQALIGLKNPQNETMFSKVIFFSNGLMLGVKPELKIILTGEQVSYIANISQSTRTRGDDTKCWKHIGDLKHSERVLGSAIRPFLVHW